MANFFKKLLPQKQQKTSLVHEVSFLNHAYFRIGAFLTD